MKLKKFLALALSAVMVCSAVNISVFAEDTSHIITDTAVPAYENAHEAYSSLTISSNKARCGSDCEGNSDVVKITAEQTLQKYWGLWIWNDVEDASWIKTVKGKSISMSNTKSELSSGTYRVATTFTLTNSSGKTETFTVYSDEKAV